VTGKFPDRPERFRLRLGYRGTAAVRVDRAGWCSVDVRCGLGRRESEVRPSTGRSPGGASPPRSARRISSPFRRTTTGGGHICRRARLTGAGPLRSTRGAREEHEFSRPGIAPFSPFAACSRTRWRSSARTPLRTPAATDAARDHRTARTRPDDAPVTLTARTRGSSAAPPCGVATRVSREERAAAVDLAGCHS
jgi:hypothetical protein